jgi:predicted transcriptional regulator
MIVTEVGFSSSVGNQKRNLRVLAGGKLETRVNSILTAGQETAEVLRTHASISGGNKAIDLSAKQARAPPPQQESSVTDEKTSSDSLELATELTIAWLSNPNTRASAEDVPSFLNRMHQAVSGLSAAPEEEEAPQQTEYTPAVSVRKSLGSRDHIISMIDGKPYKTLRRHLARHGLTPDQYRQRYGLRPDYPMVSESYSQVRRDMAKKIGLGRKAGGADPAADSAQDIDQEEAPPAPERKPRGRRAQKAE